MLSRRKHYNNNEWKEYTIEVHALKSTSRQIGAEELGELAFELEMAGKEGNIDLIKEKTDRMLEEYLKFNDLLAPLFPDFKEVKKGYADRDTIYKFLERLAEAMNDFDILCIDDIIEEMNSFEYHKTCLDYFEKLKEQVELSDFDSCTNIMEEWKECIAKCAYFTSTPNEVTLNLLKSLQIALNNYDTTTIKDKVDELSKSTYPPKQQEILEQLKEYTEQNSIDNCFELVASWRELLK